MSHYVPETESKLDQDASSLKQKVELFLATRDLLRLDMLSESDPFIVVSLKDDSNKFIEIGRTEVIWDKRDAEFETIISIDYYFEKEQILKFDVYDCDNANSTKLSDHDFAGSMTVTLGEIIHSPGAKIQRKLLSKHGKPLKNKQTKKYQSIIVRAEQAANDKNKMKIQFSGINLPKMDSWFGKVDPYFRICKVEDCERKEYKLEDYEIRGQAIQYKSETIKREYNPKWKPFEISEARLFYNNNNIINNNNNNNISDNNKQAVMRDDNRVFEVQIYDWDSNKNDDFIGSVLISYKDLIKVALSKKKEYYNIDIYPKKLRKKYSKEKDKNKPKLILENVTKLASLYDFLSGGCDFSLMVAIDYTGSNLQRDYNIDLHHIYKADSYQPSPYQMAIRKIGNILQTYDSDKKYPLWGFGAWGIFKGNNNNNNNNHASTRHGFNVNTDILYKYNEEVDGIYGLESAYCESVNKLREGKVFKLSGPTYFSNILENAKIIAQESFDDYNKQHGGKLNYFIFLIITDGAVASEDMLKTINQIVDIATKGLPMSIIIVGVGNGPFDSMNLLDGDFLQDVNEIENDPKLSSKKKEDKIWKLLNDTGYRYEYVEALRKIGTRDIVDFVELNEFDSHTMRDKFGKTLESKTLEEIPQHFMRFIQYHNILPPDKSTNININKNINMNESKEMENDMCFDNREGSASLSQSHSQSMYENDELHTKQYNNRNIHFDSAPLPPQWDRAYDNNGQMYYVNHQLKITQWLHPDDPMSPQSILKQKAASGPGYHHNVH